MKVKIKSFNGELPSYLTVGKVYKVVDSFCDSIFMIQNDINSISHIRFNYCQHLNGGSWEIVE